MGYCNIEIKGNLQLILNIFRNVEPFITDSQKSNSQDYVDLMHDTSGNGVYAKVANEHDITR